MQQKIVKRILFDARSCASSKPTGVGYYTKGLIEALAKNYPEATFVGHYFFHKGLNEEGLKLPEAPNISYKVSRFLPEQLFNQLRRMHLAPPFEMLAKSRGDVIIFPAYIRQGTLFRAKTVITIHDLAYLTNPDTLSDKNRKDLIKLMPASIKNADLILTVSEHSKSQIISNYSTPENKIHVHGLPPTINFTTTKNAYLELKKLGINKKFLLFTGTLEPRKNIAWLIETYMQSILSNEYQLVLAGGFGWKSESIISTFNKYKMTGKIIHTGYVNEESRSILLASCELLVMASIEEGFGMPILEAASFGKPALLSDIPVFHEVAADGAVYFDNKSADSFDIAARKLLKDNSIYTKTSSSAKENLKRFNWDDIAKNIMTKLSEL